MRERSALQSSISALAESPGFASLDTYSRGWVYTKISKYTRRWWKSVCAPRVSGIARYRKIRVEFIATLSPLRESGAPRLTLNGKFSNYYFIFLRALTGVCDSARLLVYSQVDLREGPVRHSRPDGDASVMNSNQRESHHQDFPPHRRRALHNYAVIIKNDTWFSSCN
jgi:hypothetical protein